MRGNVVEMVKWLTRKHGSYKQFHLKFIVREVPTLKVVVVTFPKPKRERWLGDWEGAVPELNFLYRGGEKGRRVN